MIEGKFNKNTGIMTIINNEAEVTFEIKDLFGLYVSKVDLNSQHDYDRTLTIVTKACDFVITNKGCIEDCNIIEAADWIESMLRKYKGSFNND